jgi:hypothetical protein
MNISFDLRRMARFGTGTLVFLMLQALCAPRSASAGCTHLVGLRSTSDQLPSLIERMFVNLAARPDPLPVPLPALPCAGVWCPDQPVTPPAPPGVFDDVELETWAWCRSILPSDNSANPTFLRPPATILHPLLAGNHVFHPPRLDPSVR